MNCNQNVKYQGYIKTIKETSIDTSKDTVFYVSKREEKVVDFDSFLEDYFKLYNKKAKKPESVDCLCKLDNMWCLIEFKNGIVNRKNIFAKIGHSVATILFKSNIIPKEFMENSIFILVYNSDASGDNSHNNEGMYLHENQIGESYGKDIINTLLGEKAKYPIIKYGLATFKGVYFKEVMTMDKKVFDQYIEKHSVSLLAE